MKGVQNSILKFRIPPLALALSRHPAISESLSRSHLVKFSKGHLLFLIPLSNFKLSRIQPIEMRESRSRQAFFTPYPALNISSIPNPASILSPIPHPAKPVLHPTGTFSSYEGDGKPEHDSTRPLYNLVYFLDSSLPLSTINNVKSPN